MLFKAGRGSRDADQKPGLGFKLVIFLKLRLLSKALSWFKGTEI